MMPLLRLALRDLFFQKKFLFFFIFNLYLGLLGLTAVESLRDSIQSSLHLRSKNILGADLAVGARRILKPTETDQLNQLTQGRKAQAELFEVYTMASGPDNTRLIEVRALEHGLPYYGEIRTTTGALIQDIESFYKQPEALVFPEFLIQLNLKVGDYLKLGDSEFLIRDTIANDTSSTGSGFEFAPPIYVSLEQFKKTGLLKPGATGYFSHNFKFDDTTDIENLAQNIHKKMNDPAIQVTTPKNASEQVGRALGYLTDYLGLTSLVGLLLTSLSQYFLFRRHLLRKQKDIAILKGLGSSPKQIFTLFIFQALAMSLLALILAWLTTRTLLPFIQPLVYKYLQSDLHFHITPRAILIAMASSLFGGIFSILSPLLQALQTKVTTLLATSEEASTSDVKPTQKYLGPQQFFLYLGPILVFTLLAMIISTSIQTGLTFTALVLATISLVLMIGFGLLSIIRRYKPRSLGLRLAFQQMLFQQKTTLLMFCILSLSTALVSLIPQISNGLQQELATPSGLDTPSLFLFDIQDEQVQPLGQFLAAKNLIPMQISPMIRARLVTINGTPFEKLNRKGDSLTREEENENRFRNRGFNLTYRHELSKSENITSGEDFKNAQSELPKISLEERFAKRLNIQLKDKLKFEIQGVEVEGEVVNFRHVRWTSFQPNFFIQFDDGPLNEAPKTHILTLPKIDEKEKSTLQREMLVAFPNISILEVARVVEKISSLIRQMSYAIVAMAGFTAAIGLAIVFSILNLQMQMRTRDFILLKQIGASHKFIQTLFLLESVLLTTLAILAGLSLARGLDLFITHFLFDGASAYNLQSDLIISAALLISTVIITGFIARSLKATVRESLI